MSPLCLQGKGNVVPYYYAIKDMGVGGTAPPFLTLVLDGVSGQLHAIAALPLGKEIPVCIG
jgi:hypothetical protein